VLEFGRTQTVPLNGKQWTISRLTWGIIQKFKKYVSDLVGDPFAKIDNKYFDLFAKEEQLALLKEARETEEDLKCFSLQCPLAKKYMAREEGIAVFGQLMLLESHPDVTLDQAFDVWMAVGANPDTLAVAQGSYQGNAEGPADSR